MDPIRPFTSPSNNSPWFPSSSTAPPLPNAMPDGFEPSNGPPIPAPFAFQAQPPAPLSGRPIADPTDPSTAPLAPDFGAQGSDLSHVVGVVAVGAFTTGNATLASGGSAPPNPATSAGSMHAVSVMPVADGSLRYLGPYTGPRADLSGLAMIEYRKLFGIRAGAVVGGGHPAFGVGGYIRVAAQKETTFQTLMTPEDAAQLMQGEASGGGWWKHRLEALHVKRSPVTIPDFSDPFKLHAGDTLCVNLDGKITGGMVMGNIGQRLGIYCSLEGQFQMVSRACGDGIMEVMISPEMVTEVGALMGAPLIEQFDCSRTRVQAYRLVYRFDVRNPDALAAYKGCFHGEFPMGRHARMQTWPAGVQLVRVETVDQTRLHMGGGILAPPLLPSSMHIAGLGFSIDDLNRTHTITDGRNLLVSKTAAHHSAKNMFWRGTRSTTVFVNAQYEVAGDPSLAPPRFCGLVMGTYYALTRQEAHNRKHLIDDLNHAFNLSLPYFPDSNDAHSGYGILVQRHLTLADLEVLSRFSQQQGEVQAWAARVGLDTQHLQNILGVLAAQREQKEPAVGVDATALQDNVKGLRTMGALCRLLDADQPRLDVSLECEAYDLALAAALDVQLLGFDPIDPDEDAKTITVKLARVHDAREKIFTAMRVRSGDVPRAIFQPETLPDIEDGLITALLCVEQVGDLQHLPRAKRAELLADRRIWQELTLAQRARGLSTLQHDGRFWGHHFEKQVKDVWQELHRELTSVSSETELPDIVVQALLSDLQEARAKMAKTFALAAPTLRN